MPFNVKCANGTLMSTLKIGEVKEKIAQEKGWDAAQQKLIYSGELHTSTL